MKPAGALQDDLQTGKQTTTLAAAVIPAHASLPIALAVMVHKRNIA